MTLWFVEPRDPLLVRDGRPFGANPGALATSLPFPFPSTLAGGVRSRSGLDENGGFKYERVENMSPDYREQRDALLDHLKKIRIRGPLLVQLSQEGNDLVPDDEAWLVPMPNDALAFAATSKEDILLRRLVPLTLPDGAQTDFDQKGRELEMQFVGLASADPQLRKPHTHKLRYWYWKHFQSWLHDPGQLEREGDIPISSLGQEDLTRDYRLHVSMDSEKEMGKEGLLFGTSGLEFTHTEDHAKGLHMAQRLALAVDVEDGAHGISSLAGVAGLGGERRLVTWRQSEKSLPGCPAEIKKAIIEQGHCRLVLLTPAYFNPSDKKTSDEQPSSKKEGTESHLPPPSAKRPQGYYPTWLRTTRAQESGVTIRIRGVAVRRPDVVSGWDLERGGPKPSRRLTPAGTVFFLSVQGGKAELDRWIEQTWMQCISDEDQDRCDGFGLAVLGTWSGQPVAMQ